MSGTDGGYYAIKGFEYQIDKTILELLKTQNDQEYIGLEKIQDIDSDNWVMQVKYKETAIFTPAIIREPIIQLIKEYESFSNKKYYLYCYFDDLNGYELYFQKMKLDDLNTILRNKKEEFPASTKRGFLDNFKLENAPEFHKQFKEVIIRLRELEFCKDENESVIYYGIIADHLRKIVINNNDIDKRICNRHDIIDLLRNARKTVFDSAFREYKGKIEYFKYIKKEYFTFYNINPWERFIIIDSFGTENISEVKEIVLKIKEKFYKPLASSQPKSGAPYIFFHNISSEKLKRLKTELLDEEYIFKDGYDFKNAEFSIKTITEKSTKENKICLKFIDSKENLISVLNRNLDCTKEIYQFFINDRIEINADIKSVEVQIQKIEDISKIL